MILKDSNILRENSSPSSNPQIDPLELVEHFVDTNYSWLGSQPVQGILQQKGLELAKTAPYLLHAILSVSASHLSHLRGYQKSLCSSAIINYNLSLEKYTSQLESINSDNVDSILACCLIHVILAFGNVFHTAREQAARFLEDVDEPGWTWLRAMQGFRVLYVDNNLQSHLENSIWRYLFLEDDTWSKRAVYDPDLAVSNPDGLEIARRLFEFCRVDWETPIHDNVYLQPLQLLRPILARFVEDEDLCFLLKFIGHLSSGFLELLEANDTKAMLILSYWCALFGQINQWWITRSTDVECKRICGHLEKSSDPQIRELLQFPARRCGYKLKANVSPRIPATQL